MKKCTKCKKEKKSTNFYSNGRGGLESICKDCSSRQRKEKYNSDDEYRAKKRAYAQSWRDRAFLGKTRAYWNKRARSSSMTAFSGDELKGVYDRSNKRCIYCRISMENTFFHFDHDIPGLEEVDNLVLACKPCNMFKGRRTGKDFREFLQGYLLRVEDNPVASCHLKGGKSSND